MGFPAQAEHNHRDIEQRTSSFIQGTVVNQVRPLRWHDLPLAYRLIGHGVSFDAQFSLTVGGDGLRYSLFANSGNTHAFVLREGRGAYAVLRTLPGTLCAGLGYIAPGLQQGGDEDRWTELIGGMSILAGQSGIVAIRAEVDDDTPEFDVLRLADFGVYAHQTLWERAAAPVSLADAALRAVSPDEVAGLVDAWGPRTSPLLRQANVPPGTDAECFVLEAQHSVAGMAAVYRGNGRALVDLFVPSDAHEAARDIVNALMSVAGAETTTITCRLRHDMEWVGRHLTEAGFDWHGSQAIMVRHTMAHIRRHALKELSVKRGLAPASNTLSELEPARSSAHDTTVQPI